MANLMNPPDTTSTRPYLIRALYEWCTDNGLTPYVAVAVDETVQVPREYVKNNEIVLNISFDATSSLKLSNDFIEFKARFAGSSREIMVPIGRVIAIYARENGQGMSFPMGTSAVEPDGSHEGVSAAVTSMPFSIVGGGEQERSDENKVVQLVQGESNASDPGADTAGGAGAVSGACTSGLHIADEAIDPPEPTKPQKTGRPSLKRVK